MAISTALQSTGHLCYAGAALLLQLLQMELCASPAPKTASHAHYLLAGVLLALLDWGITAKVISVVCVTLKMDGT